MGDPGEPERPGVDLHRVLADAAVDDAYGDRCGPGDGRSVAGDQLASAGCAVAQEDPLAGPQGDSRSPHLLDADGSVAGRRLEHQRAVEGPKADRRAVALRASHRFVDPRASVTVLAYRPSGSIS